ncbi:MAG: YhcH/YjgK/YiaL family protein [Opitutae bacterium]
MAIFGSFSTVRAQLGGSTQFGTALAYVAEMLDAKTAAHRRIAQLASGASERVELAGGVFAIEQVYPTKLRPEGFFESHRKYIDVQVIVAGEEVMEVEDIARLIVTDAYNPERDFLKYADTATASRLRLRAGDMAIFFPVDGHMPGLQSAGEELVRKTVVKVPVG